MGFLNFNKKEKSNNKTEERSNQWIGQTRGSIVETFNAATSSDYSNYNINEDNICRVDSVAAALDSIANTAATLPIRLFKPDVENAPQMLENDYRVNLLNVAPNDYMSGFILKKKIAKDVVLYGESATYIERVGNRIKNLYPLKTRNLNIQLYCMNGYKYTPEFQYNSANGSYIYDELDIMNIVQDSDNGITSKTGGVIGKGANVLALALAQHEYEQSLLSNGAMPSGVLSAEGKLRQEYLEYLTERFEKRYSGKENVGKTVVLEGGLDFKPITINPDKLQLDTSKKAMLGQIARLFNLPETMINSNANKYNSNEQNNIQFFQFTLKPILEAIISSLNKDLLLESEKQQGYFFKFDTDSIFQNTLEERADIGIKLFKQGVQSYDETRKMFNLPKGESNDFRLYTLGDVFYDNKTGVLTVANTYDSSKNNNDKDSKNTSQMKGGDHND